MGARICGATYMYVYRPPAAAYVTDAKAKRRVAAVKAEPTAVTMQPERVSQASASPQKPVSMSNTTQKVFAFLLRLMETEQLPIDPSAHHYMDKFNADNELALQHQGWKTQLGFVKKGLTSAYKDLDGYLVQPRKREWQLRKPM